MTKEQFMAMDIKDKKQLLKEWGEALDEADKEEESEEEVCEQCGSVDYHCSGCGGCCYCGGSGDWKQGCGCEEGEEEQYHKMCDNECCTMLTKDTPIMCYKTDKKEMTLCSTCYWEAGYWEDDENSDNEDEIEEHKLEAE
jgi:hypothetical protein